MELLRIIAMVFIIIFHYIYKSDFQYTELTINNLLIKSGYFLGELGVNLFILITGYYLCNSKPSWKKFILLVLEVFFYNLISYFISYKLGNVEISNDLSIIIPIITGKYWFITTYLLIYGLSTYFNKLIKSLNKAEYQKFLAINLCIWSIIPTIFGFFYNSSEEFICYNRFIWLSVMYFFGAYIKIYNIKILDSKKRSLVISIITFLVMILSIIFIHNLKNNFIKIGTTETAYFWTPNNILMFILSISIFKFFTKLNIKNSKLINTIASTTLGIYLLHDGTLNQEIFVNLFKNNIHIYSSFWWKHIMIATILIFVYGLIIDLIRQLLEKKIIKKILDLEIWNNMYNEIKNIALIAINKIL